MSYLIDNRKKIDQDFPNQNTIDISPTSGLTLSYSGTVKSRKCMLIIRGTASFRSENNNSTFFNLSASINNGALVNSIVDARVRDQGNGFGNMTATLDAIKIFARKGDSYQVNIEMTQNGGVGESAHTSSNIRVTEDPFY